MTRRLSTIGCVGGYGTFALDRPVRMMTGFDECGCYPVRPGLR